MGHVLHTTSAPLPPQTRQAEAAPGKADAGPWEGVSPGRRTWALAIGPRLNGPFGKNLEALGENDDGLTGLRWEHPGAGSAAPQASKSPETRHRTGYRVLGSLPKARSRLGGSRGETRSGSSAGPEPGDNLGSAMANMTRPHPRAYTREVRPTRGVPRTKAIFLPCLGSSTVASPKTRRNHGICSRRAAAGEASFSPPVPSAATNH